MDRININNGSETHTGSSTLQQSVEPSKLVMALKEEASENAVFHAMCKVFSKRERARQQITIVALKAVMKKHHFNFTRHELESELKFMAKLGLGHLDKTPKGKIRALKGIKVTLQSIGQAALSDKGQLSNFRPATKFTKVPKVEIFKKQEAKATSKNCKVLFTIVIEDKPVTFEVPGGIPAEKLGQFIARAMKDDDSQN